jgi:hypothetical protein
MNYRCTALTALVLTALAAGSALAQRTRGGDPDVARHGWLSNFEEAKLQARKTGKPLMVVLRCVP